MRKILHVAVREFMATVATRAFLMGVLIGPFIITMLVLLLPRLMNEKSPNLSGEVVVLDPTGQIVAPLQEYLAPEAIARRNEEALRKALESAPGSAMVAAAPPGTKGMQAALQKELLEVPRLDIAELPKDANLDHEKEPLKADPRVSHRLAVVVVHPDAITQTAGKSDFGSYDFYVRGKLDDRVEDDIREGLRSAIVDARIRAAGMDRKTIESLTRVARQKSITVTTKGEGSTNEVINTMLPFGFMFLLIVAVFSSGQYLLTSTIEEKSNRVVEVLLSAVSPLQLMTGKILGDMAAGFLILLLYAGLGIAALTSFAMVGLLDPKMFVFLFVFYVLSYFVFASLYAAVGSAVNDIREAQALLMPLMLMMMIPYALWMPITRNPNSTFSTVVSFMPPINFFAMLLRMTSSTPPPLWQVFASIGVGIIAVIAALWFASKVFRIGVLMYGKAPNFATLVRWARMA